MSNGTLEFGAIPALPDNWWDNPEIVWEHWDRDTYYLWGANGGNYQKSTVGEMIGGAGLAGVTGPTKGRAHPHYVGVCTMSTKEILLNETVFKNLQGLLSGGSTVLVPTYKGKYSLGTGIGATDPDKSSDSDKADWRKIQKSIINEVITLAKAAGAVNIPDKTFWPDCTLALSKTIKFGDPAAHAIGSIADLEALAASLES